MSALAVAVTLVAAAAFGGLAIADFAKASFVVDSAGDVGVPASWISPLGVLKAAGAAGLLTGLAGVVPLGIAAGAGLTGYFVGAVLAHLRAGDLRLGFPLGFLGLAVAALVAQVA